MPRRSIKQIKNNTFGHRLATNKDGGTIPRYKLEKMYERTNINEDYEDIDKYMRKTASYWGPDSVLFESDAPRRNAATNVGLLNLRLGGSLGTKADQNHSERFIGFYGNNPLGRDPRGTSEMPDFRQMVTHMETRGKQYVKSMPIDRSEDTISGGGYNPWKVSNDKQKMFYPVKDRMRIFSTSLDTADPVRMKGIGSSKHNMENAQIDLPEQVLEDVYRQPDYTTLQSNVNNTTGLSIPDHKLPVARYGDPRVNNLYLSNNVNIREQNLGHKLKDQMDYNYTIHKSTDPELLSGIVSKMITNDSKQKDSKSGFGVKRGNVTEEINRFITEYNSKKLAMNNELDTHGISVQRGDETPNHEVIRDHKVRYAPDENLVTKINRSNHNARALLLLQTTDKKNNIRSEDDVTKFKHAMIKSSLTTPSTGITQVQKFKEMHNETENASYKNVHTIGNVNQLINQKSSDMDFGDSVSIRQKRYDLEAKNKASYDPEATVYHDREYRMDNTGNDGSFMKRSKRAKKVFDASSIETGLTI